MKSKKITAWLLFAAMLITLLPNSLVFAAWGEDDCPEIITEVFGDTTNDAKDGDGNDIIHGTDLDLGGYSYTVDIPTKDDTNDKTTITDSTGTDIEVWKKADKEVKHYRRSQFLTFAAVSQASDSTKKKFIDENTDTGISEGAVEIAYMDANKNPLKIKDGTKFDMENAASWEEAWIDLTTDVQRTNVNLKTFLDPDSNLKDLRDNATDIDRTKLTAADLFATGDQISFIIYNVINGEFSGYLRVKVRDNAGMVTIQDYPFIADGQYPEIEITSTTMKNAAGSTTATAHANTFIPSAAFETATDYEDDELKISKRFPFVDNAALTEAVENVTYSDGSITKTPSDIWAMDDITISTVKVTDHEISSEIASVKYTLQHYPDGAVISGTKTPYASGELENFADGNYNIVGTTDKIVIPKDKEGQNILTIVAIDKSGLEKTDRYYFYMDKTAPDADYKLVKLEDQVLQLFSNADTVTKWQQGLDMTTSKDVVDAAQLIAGINAEDEDVYQYRLLARDYTVAEADIDLNTVDVDGVPKGYTAAAPANTNLTYGTWLDWSLDSTVAVIDEEFDGLIQVRVQDKAGNWSTVTDDEEESIIADNTDAVLSFEAFEVEEFDNSSIFAESILKTGTNVIENRETKWVKDSALLWTQVSDEDLANQIRSSGLFEGTIKIEADFNEGNEGKSVTLYGFDAAGNRDAASDLVITDEVVLDSTNISKYCFVGGGSELDKMLGFMIQYDGTGIADITFTITDKAGNVLDYTNEFTYNVRLKVDKINPIVTFKGYDETDTAMTDLLKPNTGATVDYELRNMPWGPNSQVLEVNIVDNDVTSIQSGLINGVIKVKTDKPLVIKNQNSGSDLTIAAGDVATISADYLVENIENLDYTFLAVYEGTGIAKIEVYAEDEAENVRDYPSIATAAEAEPVLYDAMLRVDKINPEIKNAKLVETDADVEDKGWSLFSFNETDADVNTRKQMKITFEIVDETTTAEQSGVNIQNEKISGVDLIDVYDKYVEKDKTHLYDNEATAYITDDANDVAVDPNIDYILLPVEAGSINGTGGTFTQAASASNEDIEALVAKYLDKEYNADGNKCEWKKASWKDGGIVVPDEFQGAIVLRTIDRVGNIDYSEPITFVAESIAPMIDFLQQEGYIYSQNNYGWSKRPYDYVEIRIKDNNESSVDAWLENVFINVTDLEGNDISTKDTVKFAHKIHANDKTVEVDPSAYTYVSLSDFTNEALYGYDVIDSDGLVEKLARDKDGYIHLGYVRVAESAKINITIFDKAKYNDADYTGNKLTATWTTRIDRTAPVIDVFELEKCDDDSFALLLRASDEESGLAPMWGDEDFLDVYNKYHKVGDSFLYKWNDDSDGNSDIYDKYTDEKGIINPGQYELPGLQYALLEEGDTIEDIEPWEFEIDPNGLADEKTAFSSEGYYRDGFEKTKVWHNYNSAITPVVSSDFDGYIVVRAVDRAGNITVMGYAPTLDITADDEWKNETQFVNVKALDISGDAISKVEYYGNNALLYPDSAKRDITTEALSGEGAFIEVVEEGITKVIVKASKTYGDEKDITLGESGLRNDIWEGNLVLGNPTATGYEDWKYQIADVKIDKTAPEFEFELYGDTISEKNKKLTETDVAVSPITIEVVGANDPTPNKDDDTMSHIASGIKTVEWCAIPEGSEEEIWMNYNEDGGDLPNANFTGTIKVRVTDNAGNVTEKSRRIKIDSATPIISISNDSTGKCSHDPVTVFVTVSESAEFSNVKSVTYKVTDENDNPLVEGKDYEGSGEDGILPLTGGTITVNREGETKIIVTAMNKAGKEQKAETTVLIHYGDLDMPTIKNHVSGDWITGTEEKTKVSIESENSFRYSVNGSAWKEIATGAEKTIELTTGKNTIRLQAFDTTCLCESDVNTYIINYDNGKPVITLAPGTTISTNESAVAMIIANKGTCSSEIKSLTYDLVRVAGSEYEPVETGRYLSPNGGNIVIASEGQWSINNIKVTMESGIEFTSPDNILVTVDKSAPELVANLTSNGEKADISLFALQETQTGYDLAVKATDAFSSQVKIEYAAVAEGDAYPDWVTQTVNSGEERVFEDVIKNAFKGSFVVKATDALDNTSVWTKNVFTEGVAPEISVTAPSSWQTEDIMMNVDVVDKGLSSTIESVKYTLYNGADTTGTKVGEGELSSIGGSIEITREGTTTVEIIAKDYAGNEAKATSTVKLDKTAPEYSRMIQLLGVYNEHEIPESEWNIIHDGWTYNHDVSLDGIKDIHSGIKKVNIKFTSADGATTETTLNSHQTSSSFSESGKYDLTLIDNAGNVRNISFAIDKNLQNVINVIGVDEVGKLNIAVTDGDDMLTFYKKENSESKYTKMYNGITDQLVDGKTGVRYIYGQNDSGKKSNTLYVIVAPSTEYGISLMSLNATPNRYLNIDTEGGNVSVTKIAEIFNPGINENISVGSVVEIDEDGVYSITTNN